MYHQMLISSTSSPLPPPFSSSSSFVLPVHSAAAPAAPSSSHLRSGMEALRSSWPEAATSQPPSQNHEEAGLWGTEAEKAGLLPSEFVDELLNLGDFGENERERMENEELEAKAVVGDQGVKKMEGAGDQGMKKMEGEEHSSPSPSSVLSEISLPAHDVEELEWVSFIIDDSLSEFPAEVVAQVDNRLSVQRESRQRNHGASVATAALPCVPLPCVVSTEAPLPCVPLPCVCPSKAKRSKRSRSVTVGWSSSPPLTDSSSTTSTTSASSSSSYLIYDHSFCFQSLPPPPPPPSKKAKLPKKRGRKPKQQPPSAGALGGAATSGERRCSHCGAQKTPQWRAGPLGAKTLCNACGVRYKSGRLLPEYRPACSPTFVDSIHSSSHRKVLELRRQKEAELVLAVGPPPVATF